MSTYLITLKDRSLEQIDGADAYQQEGQMTTFFQTGSGRNVVDTWSTRLASFRTSEVLSIRRLNDPARPEPMATCAAHRSSAIAGQRASLAPCR